MISLQQGIHMKSPIQAALTEAQWATSNLPIRLFGDPVLTRPCEPVSAEEIKSGQSQAWADQLIGFLKTYRDKLGVGRGLAANQLGISKQLVLVWLDSGPEIYLNPRIISTEGEGTYPETCISSASLVIGEVTRPWKAKISYVTLTGDEVTIEPDSIHTRILLHELDHLAGEICFDKYNPKTTRLATGDADEILKPRLHRSR
jgi:peptide deformylase